MPASRFPRATSRTGMATALAVLTVSALSIGPESPRLTPVAHASVQLTAGSAESIADILAEDWNQFDWASLFGPDAAHLWSNIAQNFLIDIANIPYNLLQATNTYATAGLGYPGITGAAPPGDYDPQHPNPTLEPFTGDNYVQAPIGPHGEWVNVGLGGTGSWWEESTGNTWGWDEGNFGQVIGLANLITPIPQFSTPFAYELQALAMMEIVANPQACPFECQDLPGYLGGWFNVSIDDALRGVTVGIRDGEPIAPLGEDISWAGQTVKFDPFFFITSFMKSLVADPAESGNHVADYGALAQHLDLVLQPFQHDIQDLIRDFNPFIDGSFLYWGAPQLYTVPALLAGLVSSATGIANPFDHPGDAPSSLVLAPGAAFLQEAYSGNPDPVSAADLPGNLGAGFLNLTNGLLGYLDPFTYLHALGIDDAGALQAALVDHLGLSSQQAQQIASDLGDWAGTLHGWQSDLSDQAAALAYQLPDFTPEHPVAEPPDDTLMGVGAELAQIAGFGS